MRNLILTLACLLVPIGVLLTPAQDATLADVAKLANVALVKPDAPAKGKTAVCHVWIAMDPAKPKDQIIVWFDMVPDQKAIDKARADELARRAKMAELDAQMRVKMEVTK